MTTEPKRPPADRGQGRKSLQGAGRSPVVQLRVTPELKDKIKQKGPQWVRDTLNEALRDNDEPEYPMSQDERNREVREWLDNVKIARRR